MGTGKCRLGHALVFAPTPPRASGTATTAGDSSSSRLVGPEWDETPRKIPTRVESVRNDRGPIEQPADPCKFGAVQVLPWRTCWTQWHIHGTNIGDVMLKSTATATSFGRQEDFETRLSGLAVCPANHASHRGIVFHAPPSPPWSLYVCNEVVRAS